MRSVWVCQPPSFGPTTDTNPLLTQLINSTNIRLHWDTNYCSLYFIKHTQHRQIFQIKVYASIRHILRYDLNFWTISIWINQIRVSSILFACNMEPKRNVQGNV
jgi:hypothetical protein